MGKHERDKLAVNIEKDLLSYLDSIGHITTAGDVSTAVHYCRLLSEFVAAREIGLRMLLAAILEGDLTIKKTSLEPKGYDTTIFIPYENVRDSCPDLLVIEKPDSKHGYIIRRKI